MEKAKSISLILGVLIMSIFIVYLSFAWQSPTKNPPQENVSAPLNESINAQAKQGALMVATKPSVANTPIGAGLIVQYGNVGIGTTTPAYKLDVVGAIRLQPSTQPIGEEGVIYYDSIRNKLKIYSSGNWKDFGDLTQDTLATYFYEHFLEFVYSGLLPATSTNLTSDISPGVAYVRGYRVEKLIPTTHTYSPSKDTYVDISKTGVFTFTAVPNGEPAPPVAPDSIRLAKVVTDNDKIVEVVDLRNLSPFPFISQPPFLDADAQALALMKKSDAEGATLLMSWDIEFAAQVVNSSNLTPSKAASIFNHSNLTPSKAASIIDNSNLSVSKVASIFNDSNLSVSKAASIIDNNNLSVARAVLIFENNNISVSRVVSILSDANISANRAQTILYEMTNYARLIDIITYGAPTQNISGKSTFTGVTRRNNLTINSGVTLTLDSQPNIIIANALTNNGTMDKTKTGGVGGDSGGSGAGRGGRGGGGLIIIVKNFNNNGIIQAPGENGENALSYSNDWGKGNDGGAGVVFALSGDDVGKGGDGGFFRLSVRSWGKPNGGAGGSSNNDNSRGGDGGSVSYLPFGEYFGLPPSFLYQVLKKATIDWWLQNIALKIPSNVQSFPNVYGAGGGGGGVWYDYGICGGGGGGGGQIIILADNFDNKGTISANGGKGGDKKGYYGKGGGGGGGGIVYGLYRTTLSSAGNLQAVGGEAVDSEGRAQPGESGTAKIYSVSGADIAENYSAYDLTIGPGDLVRIKSELLNEIGEKPQKENLFVEKFLIEKTDTPYDPQMIGVISVDPAIVLGEKGKENLRPVALVGRVPVKVSTINGEIKVGDYITSSPIPGVGMKATKPGRVIGIALESYSNPPDQIGWITVFLNPHFAFGSINSNGDFEALFSEIQNYPTSTEISSQSISDKFVSLVKAALEKLGLFVENRITKIKELITDNLMAKKARLDKIEMVDQATDEIYCIWIENGEWKKEKGKCQGVNEANLILKE